MARGGVPYRILQADVSKFASSRLLHQLHPEVAPSASPTTSIHAPQQLTGDQRTKRGRRTITTVGSHGVGRFHTLRVPDSPARYCSSPHAEAYEP